MTNVPIVEKIAPEVVILAKDDIPLCILSFTVLEVDGFVAFLAGLLCVGIVVAVFAAVILIRLSKTFRHDIQMPENNAPITANGLALKPAPPPLPLRCPNNNIPTPKIISMIALNVLQDI